MSSPVPERWRRLLPAALRDRFYGPPIQIQTLPSLTNHRGKLLSGSPAGTPVHAAAFVRQRRLVLERELQSDPSELARILVHELFHFVWARLGNLRRGVYEAVVQREWQQRARGELGWSAEHLKARLMASDAADRSRMWREYLSESFCDTAAWVFARQSSHLEYTLAPRWRHRREIVFLQLFRAGSISI